jgi:hypothetical protein
MTRSTFIRPSLTGEVLTVVCVSFERASSLSPRPAASGLGLLDDNMPIPGLCHAA